MSSRIMGINPFVDFTADEITIRKTAVDEAFEARENELLKEENKKEKNDGPVIIRRAVIINDEEEKKEENAILKKLLEEKMPERYIVNEDATILFWKDGEKTIVKKCEDDEFNPRLGFLTAFFQRHCNMTKNKANKFLANIEANVQKKTSKYVKVVDAGEAYCHYKEFIKKHFSKYKTNFKAGESPKQGKEYRVIGKGEHPNDKDLMYLIQDEMTEQVFLINERGTKEVKNGK